MIAHVGGVPLEEILPSFGAPRSEDYEARLRATNTAGLLLFATMQGIAALVTAGIVDPKEVERLVADAIGRFPHGPRTLA